MKARLAIHKKPGLRNEEILETAHPVAERAHDVLRHARGNPLEAIFLPKTVALKDPKVLLASGLP